MAKLMIGKQAHEVTGGTQHCTKCGRTARYTLSLTCWEITYGERFWRIGRRIHRTCMRCGTATLLKRAPEAGDELEFPVAQTAGAAAHAPAPVEGPPAEFGATGGRVVDQQFLALLWEAMALLQTDAGAPYQEAISDRAHPGVWGLLYDYAGTYAREWLRKARQGPVEFDAVQAQRALVRTLFDAALEGYMLYWLEAAHRGKGARRPNRASADRFIAQVNPRAYHLAQRAQSSYDPAVLYLMWELASRSMIDLVRQGVPQVSKVRQESVRQVLWLYTLGYAVGAEEHRATG